MNLSSENHLKYHEKNMIMKTKHHEKHQISSRPPAFNLPSTIITVMSNSPKVRNEITTNNSTTSHFQFYLAQMVIPNVWSLTTIHLMSMNVSYAF